MIWKSGIGTFVSNFWSFIVINPWIFFDMDNRKIPITIAIFGYKCFAKRRIF